jgi:hypothetical protein
MIAFHQEMALGTLCPVSPSTAWCRRVRTQHATRHRRPDRIAPSHRPGANVVPVLSFPYVCPEPILLK